MIDLANRNALDLSANRSHGELVPITVVVIRGEIPLGVHTFEEEVVCLPRGKSGKRYGTALGCLFLLYGFGRIGICGNVVEYGHDGDFVGVRVEEGGRGIDEEEVVARQVGPGRERARVREVRLPRNAVVEAGLAAGDGGDEVADERPAVGAAAEPS